MLDLHIGRLPNRKQTGSNWLHLCCSTDPAPSFWHWTGSFFTCVSLIPNIRCYQSRDMAKATQRYGTGSVWMWFWGENTWTTSSRCLFILDHLVFLLLTALMPLKHFGSSCCWKELHKESRLALLKIPLHLWCWSGGKSRIQTAWIQSSTDYQGNRLIKQWWWTQIVWGAKHRKKQILMHFRKPGSDFSRDSDWKKNTKYSLLHPSHQPAGHFLMFYLPQGHQRGHPASPESTSGYTWNHHAALISSSRYGICIIIHLSTRCW